MTAGLHEIGALTPLPLLLHIRVLKDERKPTASPIVKIHESDLQNLFLICPKDNL